MNRRIRTLVLALSLGCALGTSSMTSAQWPGYVGDPGGTPFSFTCGSVPVVSFHTRAGWMIDAIRAICWNGHASDWFGGSGGSQVNLTCPYKWAMRGVSAYHGWYVNALRGFCQSSTSTSTQYTVWAGRQVEEYSSLNCAQARGIKQIRGDSGDLLDRLSVFCGDF